MSNDNRPSEAQQEQTVKGIFALILATLLFASQDAITRHLITSMPLAQLMFVRYFFFALCALIYASRVLPGANSAASLAQSHVSTGCLTIYKIYSRRW